MNLDSNSLFYMNVYFMCWNPTPRTNGQTLSSLSEIASFAFYMKKEGYRESTIRGAVKGLRAIAKRIDLFDTEKVKEYLALAEVSEARKEKLANDLARFYKFKNILFDRPRYKRVEKLPFIPLESEIDALISGLGPKLSTFLCLLKECGMRAGEAYDLKWKDIDYGDSSVTVTPEKGSLPRWIKISGNLSTMLNALPKKYEYVFRNPSIDKIISFERFSRNYSKQRGKLAAKLQNPRIKEISFKTFRHFKATIEYHKTKDILHAMNLLGHKNIKNTLVYTHLVSWVNEEFICKVAKTIEETKKLMEAGFEYVTRIDSTRAHKVR